MSPRIWNRRDFNVSPNGYFTVLRSSGWFPTVRLPGGFRYLIAEPKRPAPPRPDENPAATAASTFAPGQNIPATVQSQPTEIPLQILKPTEREYGAARPILIVLAATAITCILLLWIQNP